MKKFQIKNSQTEEITHFYIAEVAMSPQPEWGNDYEVIETDVTGTDEDPVAQGNVGNAVDASDPTKPKR